MSDEKESQKPGTHSLQELLPDNKGGGRRRWRRRSHGTEKTETVTSLLLFTDPTRPVVPLKTTSMGNDTVVPLCLESRGLRAKDEDILPLSLCTGQIEWSVDLRY